MADIFKRKNEDKKNKPAGTGKQDKLTEAERKRIERQERWARMDDDPLAAFDTETPRRKHESMGYSEDIKNFGGIDTFGEIDDYYSRNFGDFANEPEKPSEKKKEDDDAARESRSTRHIKPASSLSRKQRRRRMMFSYILVFFLIVITTMLLSFNVLFRTTQIKVKKDGLSYTDEEIIEVSGIDYGDNIFFSKRKAAVKNLVEKYPYIENAEVSIRIPGTQIIEIEAAVPSYQVQFSGGFAVVSGNCRILEINEKQRSGIPLLKGIKLNHTQPGEYITFEKESTKQILDEVVKNINENEIGSIYGIDISNAANIELNYDNRITILLGLPEDVGYKLRTAKAIIEQSLSPTDKGTLDVSLCNSDRRSSYFTPIYSDTVSAPEGSKPQTSSQTSSDNPGDREYIDDIID